MGSKPTPQVEFVNLCTFQRGLRKDNYSFAATVMVSQRDTSYALHATSVTPEDPIDRYVRLDDHGRYEDLSKKTLEDL